VQGAWYDSEASNAAMQAGDGDLTRPAAAWSQAVGYESFLVDGMPSTALLIHPTRANLQPFSARRAIIKGFLDHVAALLALFVLLAPLVLIALLIKLDSPGPVFFRQPRIGINETIFRIWKFRTMYHAQVDIHGAQLTARGDVRVTRIGSWLRKWSIDELPQLFNILAGEMSLVGPRPHALQAGVGSRRYTEIVPAYHWRHVVKPGITGWAQVNGWRGETVEPYQIERRVLYDLDYIRRHSVLLDLRIILMTFTQLMGKHVF
jgi:lipopolysaccharide/colanic/teichoic acid biosynthesis glycosyltransferase